MRKGRSWESVRCLVFIFIFFVIFIFGRYVVSIYWVFFIIFYVGFYWVGSFFSGVISVVLFWFIVYFFIFSRGGVIFGYRASSFGCV